MRLPNAPPLEPKEPPLRVAAGVVEVGAGAGALAEPKGLRNAPDALDVPDMSVLSVMDKSFSDHYCLAWALQSFSISGGN